MSFIKIQKIDPTTISNPDSGHIYIGQNITSGFGFFWQKDEWGNIYYINSGSTKGDNGSSGSSGVDGTFFGSSGTSGTAGTSGKSGLSGSYGTSGLSGSSGTSATTGTSGTNGSSGTSGTNGSSGVDGNFFGSSGNSGTNGTSGWCGGYGAATRSWIYTLSNPPVLSNYFFGWSDTFVNNNLNVLEYIILNRVDIDGQDLFYWINTWKTGILKIENKGDFSNFGLYSVNTTPIIIGNTLKIGNLTCLGSNGSLVSDMVYFISFISGISGSSGTSGIGISGSSGVDGSSGTSGIGISGSSGVDGSSGISGSSGVGVGSWIDDISFDFNDVVPGVSHIYYLDVKASYGYIIQSSVLESDAILTGVTLKIGSVPVIPLSGLTVSTQSEISATSNNVVSINDVLTLNLSVGYSGTPTLIRGKIKIIRT